MSGEDPDAVKHLAASQALLSMLKQQSIDHVSISSEDADEDEWIVDHMPADNQGEQPDEHVAKSHPSFNAGKKGEMGHVTIGEQSTDHVTAEDGMEALHIARNKNDHLNERKRKVNARIAKRNLEKGKHSKELGSFQRSKGLTDPLKIGVRFKKDLDVQNKQQQEICHISGSVFIDSNRLAAVDPNDKNVKILDINQSSIISCLTLDSRPHDIANIDNKQLIVTSPDIQSLIFLDFGKTLETGKKLDVGGACQGIDHKYNMLIVSFTNPGSVKFLKMDGEVMKVISSDPKGNTFFKYPMYIAAGKKEQIVIVTDWYNNTVTKMDMNGTVIDVYRSDDLVWPLGVAVDKYDNVYIAGGLSCAIYVLSSGSRHIHKLFGLFRPVSVALSDYSNQIIVSYAEKKEISISSVGDKMW